MRRATYGWLLCCMVLAGCEKPELIRYPGDPAASVATVANTAPVVNVGEDVTVQWPTDSVQLTGSVTDDGLPTPALKYTWTASPAGVQFNTSTASQTTARFAAPGTYTLTLAVDDGALQATDALTVTVNDVPTNLAPVVNAGADLSTEVPRVTALHGTATDDGVPNATLAISWSVVGGPGPVTFRDGTAADTTAVFGAAGSYQLQLSASDGALTSTDSLVVTVGPAVYPAPDLSELEPDRGWLRATPAEVGMEAAPLAEAQAYALQAGGAGMISRYGRVVHSWGNIDTRIDVKSTTKSIGGIALALALDDNLVRIEERASTYLSTFGRPPDSNDAAQAQSITLLQLATHTAGFEKTGAYGRLLDPPGTAWRYSDGGLNWLADTLTTVYRQDLQELFKARVYSVLGINERDDIRWRNMEDGLRKDARPLSVQHREFASGMIVNVNSMARVGLLYLRRGEWSAGQRVFAASFAELVRTPRPENTNTPVVAAEATAFPEANLRYGVLWWTNATGALPNVPRDAYWAWGLGDSLIVVIPSLDLVIARAGPTSVTPTPTQRVFGDNDWNSDYSVLGPFLDPIVRAVTQ
jgi:CubicO group peptidase (beta-lactamase class C family)